MDAVRQTMLFIQRNNKGGWRTNQLCIPNQQRPSIHFLGNKQYHRITIKYRIIFLRPFVLPAIFGKAEFFFEYFYCTHTLNDSIWPNSHWNPSARLLQLHPILILWKYTIILTCTLKKRNGPNISLSL